MWRPRLQVRVISVSTRPLGFYLFPAHACPDRADSNATGNGLRQEEDRLRVSKRAFLMAGSIEEAALATDLMKSNSDTDE
jgi:hypothetical protein